MALPVMTIDGDVVAVHSHWTDDGSRIVTEATVHTGDGQDVVVSQLGGSVDGIGMITFPGPPVLAIGMHVAVAAHTAMDLGQREHVVLDSAKVLAYPPGFVRTGPTKAGHYLYWESGCVFVTIDSAGTSAIAGDDEFPIIDASIKTWNDSTASCSYLKVMSEGRKSVEVGNDKINVIKFRDQQCASCVATGNSTGPAWCRPASGSDPERCYSAEAAGLTTAVYIDDAKSARDGAIVDADIEINAANFKVSVKGKSLVSNPKVTCLSELQNTLTHELGHLQGLEHPCLNRGDPPRTDDQGNAVPSCFDGGLPATITEATMYNFQSCGETSKETLSGDDMNAICKVYPTASDPGTCEQVGQTSSGCCSASDPRPEGTLALAGTTMLLLVRRRNRSRRARGQVSSIA